MKQAVGLQWRMGGGPRAAARLRCAPAALALGWYEPGLRPERQRANANPGIGRRTERCVYTGLSGIGHNPNSREKAQKAQKSGFLRLLRLFAAIPSGVAVVHPTNQSVCASYTEAPEIVANHSNRRILSCARPVLSMRSR